MINLIHKISYTEKALGGFLFRKYTFDVNPCLTKPEIKAFVEQFYDVEVLHIHTLQYPLKRRASNRFPTSTQQPLRRCKKAIVTLKKNQKIPIYVMESECTLARGKERPFPLLLNAGQAQDPETGHEESTDSAMH